MVLGVVLPLCAFWEEWSFGGFRYDKGDLVTRPGSLLVTILLVLSQFLALHRLHWCKLVDGLTATSAGLSLVLSLIFTLALFPYYPLILLLSFFGIGLLGWIPVGSAWAALTTCMAVKRQKAQSFRFVIFGMLAGAVIFALASIPEIVVSVGVRLAQSSSYQRLGASLLRRFGNEHDLQRAGCQPRFSLGDLWSAPLDLVDPISERRARQLYTEATGRPFKPITDRLVASMYRFHWAIETTE